QRDLSGVIELMLHHAMEHVVEGVMGALFARDLLVKRFLWKSLNRIDEFVMNPSNMFQCLRPCRLTRIQDRRKVFLAGKLDGHARHPPPHRSIPSSNM